MIKRTYLQHTAHNRSTHRYSSQNAIRNGGEEGSDLRKRRIVSKARSEGNDTPLAIWPGALPDFGHRLTSACEWELNTEVCLRLDQLAYRSNDAKENQPESACIQRRISVGLIG